MKLSAALGKRRILALYLKVAKWGDGSSAPEAAARARFGASRRSSPPPRRRAPAMLRPPQGGPLRRALAAQRAAGSSTAPPVRKIDAAEHRHRLRRPGAHPGRSLPPEELRFEPAAGGGRRERPRRPLLPGGSGATAGPRCGRVTGRGGPRRRSPGEGQPATAVKPAWVPWPPGRQGAWCGSPGVSSNQQDIHRGAKGRLGRDQPFGRGRPPAEQASVLAAILEPHGAATSARAAASVEAGAALLPGLGRRDGRAPPGGPRQQRVERFTRSRRGAHVEGPVEPARAMSSRATSSTYT